MNQSGPVDFVETITVAYRDWVRKNNDIDLDGLLTEDQLRAIGAYVWNNRYVVNAEGLIDLLNAMISEKSRGA